MLFILYGAASEMGYKSREYLQSKGLELIDKYAYCENIPAIESRFGKRNYLSKDEFEKKTDSLFRYEFANVTIGFDWSQITDAVYSEGNLEKKNKLLTLSTSNIEILRKIKDVYPNDVKIIYCYIDTLCLESLFTKLPNISADEYGVRMAMGRTIKDSYTTNADVFDYTVIYGGESSIFDYNALYKQYDAILKVIEYKQNNITNEKYDIFISYCGEQVSFARDLMEALCNSNIKVFNPYTIAVGDDFKEKIEQAILNTRVYVPIVSNKSLESQSFLSELKTAINSSKNSGTVIYPIAFDYDDLNWEKYRSILGLADIQAYHVNTTNYAGSINFIDDWFSFMFSAEANLGELSNKVKECANAGLLAKAIETQQQYIVMLKNYLSVWRKDDFNMLISAHIKYLDLLLQHKQLNKASIIIDEILPLISAKNISRFEEELMRLLVEFSVAIENDQVVLDKINTCNQDLVELKEKFIHKKEQTKTIESASSDIIDPIVDKIATYGKATIELFEALFENGFAPGYRETLMSAYDRILSYCKSVNLGNEIPSICIDRIAELKNSVQSSETSSCGESTLQSLKVYLGQALPNTGSYDVFISHKSADDAIATKVYEYLQQTGRVAFCDHFTLRELHDSEYDKRIVESLENSKHLVVVASDPEFLKDKWVYSEWHRFYNDKRLNRRNGNLILVLSDNLMERIGDLPSDLRDGIEIIKTSEFRNRIDDLLW